MFYFWGKRGTDISQTSRGCKAIILRFSKLLLQPWDLSHRIAIENLESIAGWILLYDPKTLVS